MAIKCYFVVFLITIFMYQQVEASSVEEIELAVSEVDPLKGKICASVVETLDNQVEETRNPAAIIAITYEGGDCKVGTFGHVALMLKDVDGNYTRSHLLIHEAPRIEAFNRAIKANEKILEDWLKKDPDPADIDVLKKNIDDLKKQKKDLIKANPNLGAKRRVLDESSVSTEYFNKNLKAEKYKAIKLFTLTIEQMINVKRRITGVQRKLNGEALTDIDTELRINEFNDGNCLEFIEFVLTPDIFRASSLSKIPLFEEKFAEGEIGCFGRSADKFLSCFSC